jgi:hypothetical protein
MRGRYEGLTWSYEGASEQAPWIRQDGIRGSWEHVLHFGAPLVEVLPDAPEPTSAEGHRNGCQGCEHDPAAYPPCWTTEQMDDDYTRRMEFIRGAERPAGVSSVSPEGETTPGEGEAAREALSPSLEIVGDFVCAWTNSCTCEGDTGFGHRQGCGLEPIGKLADLKPALERAGWRLPLPDGEIEWAARFPSGLIVEVADRASADAFLLGAPSATLVRREVGQWIEVPPALSGVELRDVEERDDASEPSVFDLHRAGLPTPAEAAKDATARASEEQP